MVNEFINERINMAHALIDEGQYDQAVSLLKRLKTRIHDEDLISKIREWEEKHDETLSKRANDIRATNKHEVDKATEIEELVMRYSDAYLSYYHQLIQEHDL